VLFAKPKPTEPNPIIVERDRVLKKMSRTNPTSDEYLRMIQHVNRLQAMLPPEKEAKRHLSFDNLLNTAAYLTNTLLVLNFEKLNTITSKAFGSRPPRT
jgi:hypothetical protein